jgi:6-phosphogluconolactonase
MENIGRFKGATMNSQKKLLFAALLAVGLHNTASANTYVYVSNKGDGTISSFQLDEGTGKLTSTSDSPTQVGAKVDPYVISPDKEFLYALTREKPYMEKTFKINKESGNLEAYSATKIPFSYAYTSTDKSGKYLFGASYDGDMVSIFGIKDGKVSKKPLQNIRTRPNAHAVIIDNSDKYLYSTALSGQAIYQFRFDEKTGQAVKLLPGFVSIRYPMTPRHLVISKDNHYMYVVDESAGRIITLKRNIHTGHLRQIDTVPSVDPSLHLRVGAPRGEWRSADPMLRPHKDTPHDIWAAQLHLTPDNHFLYSSERTSSTINIFKIDLDTHLPRKTGSVTTEKQPRGFAISPSGKYLIAAGEKSDKISAYKINRKTGDLKLKGRYPVGKDPIWVRIVDFDDTK